MLTDIQLLIIATIGSIIVWGVKLAKADVHAGWLTTGVYVVSFGLAYAFAPLALPPIPPFVDLASFIPAFMAWFGALMVPLSALVGFATLVYNALLKAILDSYLKPLLSKTK